MKKLFLLPTVLFCFVCIYSYGKDTDKPRNGEGIYAFLKRNNCPGEENFQKFIELNRNKLGKDETLLLGITYRLPSSSQPEKTDEPKAETKETGYEPLFGKKYATYEIESDRLKGACFFLSSGHGGPDPGAVNKTYAKGTELHEDEYAYDITLRLARALLKEGAEVYIIIQDAKDGIRDERFLSNSKRETCMGAPISADQKVRLKQRSDKINELSKKSNAKYQRAIFIHLDARDNKNERIDIYSYYRKKNEEEKALANTLKDTFREKYDKYQPGRGYKGKVKNEDNTTRFPFVLTRSNLVSVFLELGNIHNDKDLERFLLVKNRQYVADWTCDGLIKDYENSKK